MLHSAMKKFIAAALLLMVFASRLLPPLTIITITTITTITITPRAGYGLQVPGAARLRSIVHCLQRHESRLDLSHGKCG